MRNALDRCFIAGGETFWNDVPCIFHFVDAVKSEALYGGQVSKGSLMIPLYVVIPESSTVLSDYEIILTSPQHQLINQPMWIDSIRWSRLHQTLILSIPDVAA
jgi:hypothetical protein